MSDSNESKTPETPLVDAVAAKWAKCPLYSGYGRDLYDLAVYLETRLTAAVRSKPAPVGDAFGRPAAPAYDAPRLWDAETIKDAPRIEGRIDLNHAYRVRNRKTGEWSHSLHTWPDARDLMVVCVGDHPPADAAFGPLPQPPAVSGAVQKGGDAHPQRSEVEERVIGAIRARRDAGRKKYGTTMERTDLTFRNWLQHAQEEALDFAVYLEKLKDFVDASGTPLTRRSLEA